MERFLDHPVQGFFFNTEPQPYLPQTWWMRLGGRGSDDPHRYGAELLVDSRACESLRTSGFSRVLYGSQNFFSEYPVSGSVTLTRFYLGV